MSITDVIALLTESIDPNAYCRKLKQRLKVEENETVTNCHGLKIYAADGKMRIIDVADSWQIFRLIQSIPSPKAEPFKLWLAKVAAERYNHLKNRVEKSSENQIIEHVENFPPITGKFRIPSSI